jgi:cation:H+ antiporter
MLDNLLSSIESGPAWVAWVALVVAFVVLAKSADFFVDSSVGIATRLHVPRLVIGLVLVSVATTTPELSVSMMAARFGNPEMALGNAIGSVICNCGVALGLCGLLSVRPVPVIRRVFLNTAAFLSAACVIVFLFVWSDGMLGRLEGGFLLLLLVAYLGVLFVQYRRGDMHELPAPDDVIVEPKVRTCPYLAASFLVGLGGVILASRFVVVSAVTIAGRLGIPESIIALTLVALGTSVPEVATSVVAAIKGEGALSVGNILGANIMNICWVAAASALVNPLAISRMEMGLMFPAMFLMVAITLFVLHTRNALSRIEGVVLVLGYVAYVLSFFVVLR